MDIQESEVEPKGSRDVCVGDFIMDALPTTGMLKSVESVGRCRTASR